MQLLWLFVGVVIALLMWKSRREGMTSDDAYELSQMHQGRLELIQYKLNGLAMNPNEIRELQRKVNKNSENVVDVQTEMEREDPNRKPFAYPDDQAMF